MECPYCGQELEYHDYFGRYLGKDRWDKKGEIYKCQNEECESMVFNYFFYTRLDSDNLQEGYPC
jgi:hypothetical protein